MLRSFFSFIYFANDKLWLSIYNGRHDGGGGGGGDGDGDAIAPLFPNLLAKIGHVPKILPQMTKKKQIWKGGGRGGGTTSAKGQYDGGDPREMIGMESRWRHDMTWHGLLVVVVGGDDGGSWGFMSMDIWLHGRIGLGLSWGIKSYAWV